LNVGVTTQTSIGNTNNIIANWATLGVGIASGTALTASAMLHVRGDGTNPVARFENSAGTAAIVISSDALTLSARNYQIGNNSNLIQAFAGAPDPNGSSILYTSIATTAQLYAHNFVSGTRANLTGTSGQLNISGSFAAGAGAGNFRPAGIEYTINNSGAQTGTATGIFLNATETALNGMGHNLMDLQVGGVSRFRVSNGGIIVSSSNISTTAGSIYAANGYSIGWSGGSQFSSSTDGIINLLNSGFNNFNRLNFGGTTNAFPAIKRNGAAIDFRLADDSAFCSINTLDINTRIVSGNTSSGLILRPDGGGISGRTASLESFTSGLGWTQSFSAENGKDYGIMSRGAIVGASTLVASAILQADSTTKGFLLPRMTTTQKNAITTPATGLVLYDSTLNKLCVYTGSAWETITSV
jgi:hypothetical protein